MTWFGWAFIGFFGLAILLTIQQIGAERKPLTPSTVMSIVLLDAAIIVGALAVGTGRL